MREPSEIDRIPAVCVIERTDALEAQYAPIPAYPENVILEHKILKDVKCWFCLSTRKLKKHLTHSTALMKFIYSSRRNSYQ
jgi:hypothetical protein